MSRATPYVYVARDSCVSVKRGGERERQKWNVDERLRKGVEEKKREIVSGTVHSRVHS